MVQGDEERIAADAMNGYADIADPAAADNALTAQALAMAETGDFCSWRLIEIELRFMQGRREFAGLFADRALRDEVDRRCRMAWRAKMPLAPRPAVVATPEAIPQPEATTGASAAVPASTPAPPARTTIRPVDADWNQVRAAAVEAARDHRPAPASGPAAPFRPAGSPPVARARKYWPA